MFLALLGYGNLINTVERGAASFALVQLSSAALPRLLNILATGKHRFKPLSVWSTDQGALFWQPGGLRATPHIDTWLFCNLQEQSLAAESCVV